ncbi:protein NETWORKED 3A-like [Rhododendron vialii]|uniref:protein NETWORKED 3A-like n=1 Tax=Rhododendron vialii TaxID=182163 RepID=UPI00265EFEAA|nr:protein NETWORKED 3A-like [Rhododendron vialii]
MSKPCDKYADLDRKTRMMLNLIEEDGDSFAKRAEMYYEKRPELKKMVEDLHKSYRSLAEKYDQLRSDSTELSADHSSTPLSSSFKQVQHPHITGTRSFKITKVAPTNSLERETNEQNRIGGRDAKIDGIESDRDGRRIDSGIWEREQTWDELRLSVSELMEDVSRQQAELIRRSDEKREKITALRIHISRLTEENTALKDRVARYADVMKQNQSPMSKMKGLILGRSLR